MIPTDRTSASHGWILAWTWALAACGSGTAAAVVDDERAEEAARVPGVLLEWEAPVTVAAGGAHRGPWRMNRSDWRFVDDPTVALQAEGLLGVAWVDHTRKDVLFQLYGGDGAPRFAEPVDVSRSPEIFSWLPRLVLTDGADPETLEVHLVWQEIVFSGGSHGGEIFHARSLDGGATWSMPRNLSNTTAGAGKGRLTAEHWHNGSYDLVRAPGGELYVAWTEYEGNLWFSRSLDGGTSFSEPLHVAGGGDRLPARGPALAVDRAGRILLAWTVGESPSADVHLAVSADGGGSFGAPRPIHRRPGHADAPELAVDGTGTVHLVYAESAEGPSRRYSVLHAAATGDDLGFGPPRELSGALPGGFESAHFPCLGLDGAGRLHVVWELYRDPRGRPTGLCITSSSDGGRTFAGPTLVPGSVDPSLGFNGSQQGLLMRKLAVNARGELALVNSTFRQDDASRILLWRARPAATAQPRD